MFSRPSLRTAQRADSAGLRHTPNDWRLWVLIPTVVVVATEVVATVMSLALFGSVSAQGLVTGFATAGVLAPISVFFVRYLLLDMLQREQAAERESTKLQQTIIDAAPMRIFWKDRDLRYLGCNQAFATDAGMAHPNDLAGKDDYQMGWAEQAELYRTDDRAIMESGLPRLSFDEPQKTPDGQTLWLRTSKVPLRNVANETVGILGIYEDITERKLTQDTLARTREQLIHAGKLAALGAMVAGISHELNTPIGNSLMAASTLSDHTRKVAAELADGQLRRSLLSRFIDDARTASEILMGSLSRAAQLITDFKQLAVDQTHLHRRKFELDTFARELLTTLGPSIQKTPFVVVTDIPPGLVLDTFAGPLGQVITNLVNNAILHGFDGRQDGEMRLSAAMLDADHVRIRFSDNGVGISASDAVHVTEPFFTTKMGQGGTGLGLSIVHNIVTGPLGGTMELASELGKGTTFTLVLPRVALSSSAPQELAPRSALA